MAVELFEPLPGHCEQFGDLLPMIVSPLPLFKTLQATGVVQQLLTNCPIPALLAAMAHAAPSRIRAMVHQKKLTKPLSTWFHKKDIHKSGETLKTFDIITVKFQNRIVEISPRLYADDTNNPRFAKADDGSGWVSYIEKAYVAYRGQHNYANLDLFHVKDPLTVERIVEDIAHEFDKLDLDEKAFFNDMEPVNADPPDLPEEDTTSCGSVFIANTSHTTDAFQVVEENQKDPNPATFNRQGMKKKLKNMLRNVNSKPTIATTENHTLAILSFDGKIVTLYNPLSNKHPRTSELAVDEFIKQHEAVYQVRI